MSLKASTPAIPPTDHAPHRALALVDGEGTAPMRLDRGRHRQASPVGPGVVVRRGLLEQLDGAGRVVEVSAPAGSGKTLLLRSWIDQAGLADSAAWVSVAAEERDGQRFWLSVLDALRDTAAGAALVRELTPAPDLHTGEIVERLLEDLDCLEVPIQLVIDDLHELRSAEALRQLELLVMRAPAALRFVFVTRHDVRLGLHRLRLQGGLTEIRRGDLRFTADQARELLEAAGVELSGSALAMLFKRTEGWAAGLRLAALSLAGHPDPERFAAEFSGNERTVAEYLVAEVLERQPAEVRRLLLRTSVLQRVSGPLADQLTGDCSGERILQELEQANAFVVSLDTRRSWFRYHRLFADLLALELRRTEPEEIPVLHGAAAGWFLEHGYPVEAIRHAQAAESWSLAAQVLCDRWLGLRLDGEDAGVHELLAGFPARVLRANPELVALLAADELDHGSLEKAERYLEQAASLAASVPAERRERFQLGLATRRVRIARLRGNLETAIEEGQQLVARATPSAAAQLGLGWEQRAVALIELGIAETYSGRNEEAEQHLEQGVLLARQTERPYLELLGLAHGARNAVLRSATLGAERCERAIQLAERHGWGDEPLAGVAYGQLASVMLVQGRLGEAERWLERAERTLRAELDPAAGVSLRWSRGALELVRGRPEQALEAFRAAERLAGLLGTPHMDLAMVRAQKLQALVRLGQTERVEEALAKMDKSDRDTALIRAVTAALWLAGNDPLAATDALGPAIASSVAAVPICLIEALLLEAIARDALGDAGAAETALEQALELAEPDGLLFPFLLHPVRELLERHTRHRTAHGALISELLNLHAGTIPAAASGEPVPLHEALSEGETRVLRYLPTNLTLRDIGNELSVSVHTIKTHIKHIYGKLEARNRAEAVERARTLGLLAPSARGR